MPAPTDTTVRGRLQPVAAQLTTDTEHWTVQPGTWSGDAWLHGPDGLRIHVEQEHGRLYFVTRTLPAGPTRQVQGTVRATATTDEITHRIRGHFLAAYRRATAQAQAADTAADTTRRLAARLATLLDGESRKAADSSDQHVHAGHPTGGVYVTAQVPASTDPVTFTVTAPRAVAHRVADALQDVIRDNQ